MQGGQDYWVVKISSSGNKQWDKRFGGSAAKELRMVVQTSDGGYLLAGRSALTQGLVGTEPRLTREALINGL